MPKETKSRSKSAAPPVVSTLPPPDPPKPKRKRALPDDIPRGSLPAPKRKAAQAKPPAKASRKSRSPKPDPSPPWDAAKEAFLAKQALLEREKAAKPIVAPEGAMLVPGARRARKPKGETVERKLEPMAHGGALKRASVDKPDPREAAPVKTGVPAEPCKRAVRPKMDAEMFAVILGEIAEGIPLRQICRRESMPSKDGFYRYMDGEDLDPESPETSDIMSRRLARYARARKLGYDALAEESLEIADDGTNDWVEREKEDGRLDVEVDRDHIQRSKLRIETRLKLLAVWDPKRYGNMIKVGDPDAKPLDRGGKSASDLAIGMAKLLAAAQREAEAAGDDR